MEQFLERHDLVEKTVINLTVPKKWEKAQEYLDTIEKSISSLSYKKLESLSTELLEYLYRGRDRDYRDHYINGLFEKALALQLNVIKYMQLSGMTAGELIKNLGEDEFFIYIKTHPKNDGKKRITELQEYLINSNLNDLKNELKELRELDFRTLRMASDMIIPKQKRVIFLEKIQEFIANELAPTSPSSK